MNPHTLPGLFDRVGWALKFINAVDEPAYRKLITLGRFDEAQSVLEIGGGNGWLAERLLNSVLPAESRYVVSELSPVLKAKITSRLAAHRDRATVVLVKIDDPYPFEDQFDRIVAAFVHDLMPLDQIQSHIEHAHRLLADGGILCLLVTGRGRDPLSQIVMGAWRSLFHIHPALVGGSRPVNMRPYLHPARWSSVTVDSASGWGFASDIIIAAKATGP